MSEYLAISEVKDLLAECPICSEHFDDTSRIPRRMPCCVQSICQPCLETYSKGRQTLSCPLCRHQHHLPGGIKSLPKEAIILRMLEHLKIQKGLKLPCTDCPDNETASARCEDCGVYLCHECKRAHSRHVSSRHHKIIALEEMTDRPVESFRRLHQCKDHNQPLQFYCNTCEKVVCVGCTVVEHKEGKGHDVVSIDMAHAKKTESMKSTEQELEKRSHQLRESIQFQTKTVDDIKVSSKAAKQLITTSIDKLINELQKRRTDLVANLDKDTNSHVKKEESTLKRNNTLLGRITSSLDYVRAVKSKADKIEDLQLMTTIGATFKDLARETAYKEPNFERRGIVFVPSHFQNVSAIIHRLGLLRLVTFTKCEYGTTMTLDPQFYPEVQPASKGLLVDDLLVLQGSGSSDVLECPHLEFDVSTATESLTLMTDKKVVTNAKPVPNPPDTGCRFRESSNVMSTRPIFVTNDKKLLFGMKIQFNLNCNVPGGYSVLEIALENPPSDRPYIPVGCPLLVMLQECSTHNCICLIVQIGDQTVLDAPVAENKPGMKCTINLCFLFDGKTKKFHLVNEGNNQNIVSSLLRNDLFDKPHWLRVHMEDPILLSLRAELCSGKNYCNSLSSEMQSAISRLTSGRTSRAGFSSSFRFASPPGAQAGFSSPDAFQFKMN